MTSSLAAGLMGSDSSARPPDPKVSYADVVGDPSQNSFADAVMNHSLVPEVIAISKSLAIYKAKQDYVLNWMSRKPNLLGYGWVLVPLVDGSLSHMRKMYPIALIAASRDTISLNARIVHKKKISNNSAEDHQGNPLNDPLNKEGKKIWVKKSVQHSTDPEVQILHEIIADPLPNNTNEAVGKSQEQAEVLNSQEKNDQAEWFEETPADRETNIPDSSKVYFENSDQLTGFTMIAQVDDSTIHSESSVFVNGKFCKDPKLATAEDFFLKGLDITGNTSNKVGSNVTQVNVAQIAGLNTLGVSLARIDYAPYGLNPPHTHPRATEILTVLEGTLYVGFVTSNPDNRLITKVLNKGDVFVFPEGLIHFQFNTGYTNAVAIAGLSSQNPGVITIANAVFGSKPPISDDVLAKAFQVDKKVVDYLQAQFWVNN
ncbi:hypothetical protein HHK36_013537 [Tetracentron sinense]|uniref:Cupin type-1 domain-containing protein n=1 Tax=Tetracentron sinense TaxID=13715 RepID=A0A834Z684_TETSI|nr:hypothetical protein HHK36_013537 [Tetracentron sinense]